MDINTQNSSGMMNGMPPVPQQERKVGPIIGALIIVLILIVAALYFFGLKLNTETMKNETPTETTMTTDAGSMTASVTKADDVSTLKSDLDSELKDIDYSF